MIKFRIFNQRLSYYGDSEVVADSKGYLTFTLETSEDWANYVGKTVQFTRDGKTYSVTNISDGVEYVVPWEVLVGAGVMQVNAFAVSMVGSKRATTNEIQIEVIDSGFNPDDLEPTDPTPDIFEQYVQQVQENADKAEQAAKDAKDSADTAQELKNKIDTIYQNVKDIKSDIEDLLEQVQNYANNAYQYAEAAKLSAQQASKSETEAGRYAGEAKVFSQNAKQSELNAANSESNAAESAESAKLDADRAQANQEIVTEAKEQIDTIYADIQTRHENIQEIEKDLTNKAENVNMQYLQIQEWYEKFHQAASYLEFTDEISEDLWVADGDTYTIEIDTSGKAILNIQMKDEANNQYIRVPFVDMEFNTMTDKSVTLRAIYPFAGRLCIYDLVEGVTENV